MRKHGLAFLATLAFTGGFFGARIFHTLFPEIMVITQGIHFHHFWYGLALMGIAGWLGIAENDERYNRVYAVVFGLGVGFVGDEVGLLLTFGDYYSTLTFEFFIAAIVAIILIALLLRHREEIQRDVFGVTGPEHLMHIGVFLAGFSAIFLAFGVFVAGIPLFAIGVAIFVWGFGKRRRTASGSRL